MSALPQSQLFLWEAFCLISNTTILGVFYGVTFTLYCLCARSLYLQLQEPDKRQRARLTLGYISLAFFCTTAYLILSTCVGQLAFIKHANFPGGPLVYLSEYNLTTEIYFTATGIFNLTVEVLMMAMQIWRLRIIWSGTRYATAITILPLLLLFSFVALGVPINIVAGLLPLDQHGISNRSAIAMDTASYAVLTTSTILVTGLVIARLWLARRRHIRIMGTSDISSPYMSIIAMLTESYALDTAWSIASTISDGLNGPSYYLFVLNDSTIKVIAYFLVVYRVASGRGWTRDTERELTSLQWNPGAQTATNETRGTQSWVPATTTMMGAVGSLPRSHPESPV